MRRLNIEQELSFLDHHRKRFNSFLDQSIKIISKLYESFADPKIDLPRSEINNNSFTFTFLGLTFFIKAEILFDKDNKGFYNGELNTYLLHSDDQFLILSYNFDNIGNIENSYLIDDFFYVYYIDFVRAIIEYSTSNNIKFQLR